MKKIISQIFALFVIFTSNTMALDHMPGDFIVKNFNISEVAQNSEMARQNASISAKKHAFNVLMNRFIGDEVELAIKDDEIDDLIDSIEITNEVITNQNYAANFTIYFNEKYTVYFLESKILDARQNVPSILVLPLMHENGFIKLWQMGNQWKRVLGKYQAKTVVNIKIPTGDIDDLDNFIVNSLDEYSDEQIEELKQNYDVDKIILARVYYNYNIDYTEVELSLYLEQLGRATDTTLLSNDKIEIDESLNDYLNDYAELLIAKLDDAWINFSSIAITEKQNEQLLVFPIGDIQELAAIKANLNKLLFISKWEINSISTKYLGIKLFFDDTPLNLIESLREEGYKISRKNGVLMISQ